MCFEGNGLVLYTLGFQKNAHEIFTRTDETGHASCALRTDTQRGEWEICGAASARFYLVRRLGAVFFAVALVEDVLAALALAGSGSVAAAQALRVAALQRAEAILVAALRTAPRRAD